MITLNKQHRRYEKYCDSGVEWLGKIPEKWETKKLKFATHINSEKLEDNTDPNYELGYVDIGNVDSNGKIVNTEAFTFENAPSRARRKVKHNDTIISTVRTYLKAIGYIDHPAENLIVSTGFSVLRPSKIFEPKFLWRLISSHHFVDAVVSHSDGVSYPAINPTRLATLPVWIPPHDTQSSIASYLDKKCALIDETIAKKQRQIELLKEKRTVIINRAVTRGLDEDMEMKKSGVEWIGKIPKHWQVVPLKWFIRIKSGDSLSNEQFKEEGKNPVMGGNGEMGRTDLENSADETIIVGRVGANCGNVHFYRGKAWVTDNALVLFSIHGFDLQYLAAVLKFRDLNEMANKSAQPLITGTMVKNVVIPMPPSEEQKIIINNVQKQIASVDKILEKINISLSLLSEYKTSLISHAVTGRIKVS